MDNSASVVYQSGQTVPLTGQYELAGVELKPDGTTGEKIVCNLNAHDLFPDYEGRACAWHPVGSNIPILAPDSGLEAA